MGGRGWTFNPNGALVLRLVIEPKFEQTAVFLCRLYVPLSPKVLKGRWCLPTKSFEKGSREANNVLFVIK